MWASVTFNPANGEIWGNNQTVIAPDDVTAVKLIMANHNFENPHP